MHANVMRRGPAVETPVTETTDHCVTTSSGTIISVPCAYLAHV